MSKRRIRARPLLTIAVFIAILIIALLPSATGPSPPFSFEIGTGRRWLADGILNVALFVPLGLALAWNSGSPISVAICGLLFSSLLEIAQIKVPGRDPALADIVFNTLGAAMGAFIGRSHRFWLTPDATQSRTLTVLSLASLGWVMILTAVLLAPIQASSFALSRVDDDLVLLYDSRASELGLDEPEYWLHKAFSGAAPTQSSPPSVVEDKTRWRVTTSTADHAILGPTVGRGWSLLAYPDAIGRRWSAVFDGLWMLVLCVPLGFWARGRLRLISAAIVIVLLLLIPWLTGIVETTSTEWVGATIGFLVGSMMGSLVVRRADTRLVETGGTIPMA